MDDGLFGVRLFVWSLCHENDGHRDRLLADMFDFIVSGPACLTPPDDGLYAMHPAFTSYSTVQVMIYVPSKFAGIALGITTLTRNVGVTGITTQ